jgi:superfamily I DNA/RNA helicase
MSELVPNALHAELRALIASSNTIKVMIMKVIKGLEFPVVALPGAGHMPAKGEDEQEASRVFYVAATRATQRLVIGVGGGVWSAVGISEWQSGFARHTQFLFRPAD